MLNAETYSPRKTILINNYSRGITLPMKLCKANNITKETEMLVIAKCGTFVVVPLRNYSINPALRERIEKFFEEEKI